MLMTWCMLGMLGVLGSKVFRAFLFRGCFVKVFVRAKSYE